MNRKPMYPSKFHNITKMDSWIDAHSNEKEQCRIVLLSPIFVETLSWSWFICFCLELIQFVIVPFVELHRFCSLFVRILLLLVFCTEQCCNSDSHGDELDVEVEKVCNGYHVQFRPLTAGVIFSYYYRILLQA